MTEQAKTQNLQVGDRVYVALPNYIKESCDYINGEWFAHTFYGSTGTVVATHMVEEGLPAYTRVYFESIDEQFRPQVEEVFTKAFEQVQGQYVSDNWSKVGTYIQPQLVSVYNGQETMENVLESAQQQFGK